MSFLLQGFSLEQRLDCRMWPLPATLSLPLRPSGMVVPLVVRCGSRTSERSRVRTCELDLELHSVSFKASVTATETDGHVLPDPDSSPETNPKNDTGRTTDKANTRLLIDLICKHGVRGDEYMGGGQLFAGIVGTRDPSRWGIRRRRELYSKLVRNPRGLILQVFHRATHSTDRRLPRPFGFGCRGLRTPRRRGQSVP